MNGANFASFFSCRLGVPGPSHFFQGSLLEAFLKSLSSQIEPGRPLVRLASARWVMGGGG